MIFVQTRIIRVCTNEIAGQARNDEGQARNDGTSHTGPDPASPFVYNPLLNRILQGATKFWTIERNYICLRFSRI